MPTNSNATTRTQVAQKASICVSYTCAGASTVPCELVENVISKKNNKRNASLTHAYTHTHAKPNYINMIWMKCNKNKLNPTARNATANEREF